MGKGDKKTKRGKIIKGSHGKKRPRKVRKTLAPATAKSPVKKVKETPVMKKPVVQEEPVITEIIVQEEIIETVVAEVQPEPVIEAKPKKTAAAPKEKKTVEKKTVEKKPAEKKTKKDKKED